MSTSDTPDFIRRFRERMKDDDRAPSRIPRRIRPRSVVHRGSEVGRGGLGIVYSYYDSSLKREVAVKVANKRVLLNAEKLERFEREYRLTAQLQHPGVPAIYSSGILSDGRPYYVMRLITGRPLAELIAELHGQAIGRFSTANERFQRLIESLLTCCDAISFAHDRGILHRDIKPQNIVVEPDGTTFVIDWGLAATRELTTDEAKGTQPTDSSERLAPPPLAYSQTNAGRFMGTPAYMSPEQAQGDPHQHDQQTDVYGLGATFFHILAGKAPHDLNLQSTAGKSPNTSWKEHIQVFAQPALDRFADDTPAELVSICRKAMSLSKTDRYATVQAFANDLRRWQRHEMVEAHRPLYRWSDRTWVLLQKHRRWVTTALITLVTLTLASVVSMLLISGARQRELTQLRREAAANNLLLSGMEDWSAFVMRDQLLSAETFQPLRLEMLDKLSSHYQEWVSLNSDGSPESMQRATRGLLQLARIHDQSARSDVALETYQKAIDLSALLPAFTFDDGTVETLMKERALAQSKIGDSQGAEQSLREVLRQLPRREYLADRDSITADLLHAVGGIHISQADAQPDASQRVAFYLDALNDFEAEIEIWHKVNDRRPTFESTMGLAVALNAKALCQHKAVNTADAVATYKTALNHLDEMQSSYADDSSQAAIKRRRAGILLNMGMSLLLLNDLQSAEEVYRSAIDIYQEFHQRYPLVLGYREELARGWGNLADLYVELDGNEKEIHAREQVINLSRELLKLQPQVQVHAAREMLHTVRLCFCLHQNARADEAGVIFRDLLRKYRAPEVVERLNHTQQLKCALCYLMAAALSSGEGQVAEPGVPSQSELTERAVNLVLGIPVDIYRKYPLLHSWVMKDPFFEPVRNSKDPIVVKLISQLKAESP